MRHTFWLQFSKLCSNERPKILLASIFYYIVVKIKTYCIHFRSTKCLVDFLNAYSFSFKPPESDQCFQCCSEVEAVIPEKTGHHDRQMKYRLISNKSYNQKYPVYQGFRNGKFVQKFISFAYKKYWVFGNEHDISGNNPVVIYREVLKHESFICPTEATAPWYYYLNNWIETKDIQLFCSV